MCEAKPPFEAYSIDHLKLHSFSQEELEGGEIIQLSHCFLCVHAYIVKISNLAVQ